VAAPLRFRWLAAALLGSLALAAVLVLPNLGERPLYSAGEVRVALVARDMVERGDWIQPHLNHVRYYEKPPLLYWSVAAVYEALGFTELASRLPAALAYIGTVAAVFLLALELLGATAAPYAALIFATAPAAFHFGRFVSIDTLLTFFSTTALLGLALATRDHRRMRLAGGRRVPHRGTTPVAASMLFWGSTALAGMTKGLVGVIFPLATVALYALLFDPTLVRRLRPAIGIPVFAALYLPWHLALAWRDPSFVSFYLLNEHVYRFLNIREPIDYDSLSIGGFWMAAALWFFPWSLLWPPALAWSRRQRNVLVPLLWIAVVMGFFTLSRARLEYYAQPTYPAFAVLVAGYWTALDSRRERTAGLLVAAAIMIVLGAAAAAIGAIHPDAPRAITTLVSALDGYYREYFTKNPDKAFFFTRQALDLAPLFAVAWLALGTVTFWTVRRRRPLIALACWIACLTPTASGFDRGIRLIAEDRAQRTAAEIVNSEWESDARLVVGGTYEDAAGITFYTGKPTLMLDADGGDLLFGHQRGDAPDLFLTLAAFDELWSSPARVFLLAQRELRPPAVTILLETPRQLLLTNHPRRVD
jgi:4-amino-4-deoxy-L-arabinose transferase-like glycosyltransferase